MCYVSLQRREPILSIFAVIMDSILTIIKKNINKSKTLEFLIGLQSLPEVADNKCNNF